MDVKKRFLFLGPTGAGKSTLINVLCNENVIREFMDGPAPVNSTAKGVTKSFTTYYDSNKYAFTDSIGFGDESFTEEELVALINQLLENAIVGYNRIYLCIQYGRISIDVWRYVDLITSIFSEQGLNWCTIIFTHCNEIDMNVERFLDINKNDERIKKLVGQVANVIFGDLQSSNNPQLDFLLQDLRQNLLNNVKRDISNSSNFYYFPKPNDHNSWISSVCNSIERFTKVKLPLDKVIAHIKSITIIKVDNVHYYGECSICYEVMHFTNSVITNCGHIFHKRCIADWFSQRHTCPKCIRPCALQQLLNWLPDNLSLHRSSGKDKQ